MLSCPKLTALASQKSPNRQGALNILENGNFSEVRALTENPDLLEPVRGVCVRFKTLALALFDNEELVANFAFVEDKFALLNLEHFEPINELHLFVNF